ncbi:hypothetical protein ABW21_db0206269 [Orbilia brochopaga]|nr:hypothetical protein ABW21_db0206269 [Drechslerella brochopaga]
MRAKTKVSQLHLRHHARCHAQRFSTAAALASYRARPDPSPYRLNPAEYPIREYPPNHARTPIQDYPQKMRVINTSGEWGVLDYLYGILAGTVCLSLFHTIMDDGDVKGFKDRIQRYVDEMSDWASMQYDSASSVSMSNRSDPIINHMNGLTDHVNGMADHMNSMSDRMHAIEYEKLAPLDRDVLENASQLKALQARVYDIEVRQSAILKALAGSSSEEE